MMNTRCVPLVFAAVGCAAELDLESIEQESVICPPWRCANSAELTHEGMHEANVYGQPNAQNLTLDGLDGKAQLWRADGVPFTLIFDNNAIRGWSPVHGWLYDPVNARLQFSRDGKPAFWVTITSRRWIKFPVGDEEKIEVYQMLWHMPGTTISSGKRLCNGSHPAREDLFGMRPTETLIFTHDRIDPETMTMNHDPDPGWFNFACAGFTLAKLHLSRNTLTSQPDTWDPTDDWANRQATLKMFVADYCGNGNPVTVTGTPIRWKGGLVTDFAPTPQVLEARWNENGASCRFLPRLVAYPAPAFFPDPLATIDAMCALPQCTDFDFNNFDNERRVTAVPW
jgi:hypothetical protein